MSLIEQAVNLTDYQAEEDLDWHGLYREGWNSEIVPEAFSHPAKFSRALIRQIYQHAIDEGWLWPGDFVLDPFGGVALGGLDAMRHGLNWVGVELEEKFVALGNKNIDLWMERYAPHFPGWGRAVLLQGDSRELGQVVAGCDGVVSSPPFSGSLNDGLKQSDRDKYKELARAGRSVGNDYGTTPGQLGAMKPGEFDAAVSSPPYTGDALGHAGEGNEIDKSKRLYSRMNSNRYGENTPGQLGAMKPGEFDAAVSSPPYEGSMQGSNVDPEEVAKRKTINSTVGGSWLTEGRKRAYATMMSGYNPDNENNLGSSSGDTFWTAARQIVDQVYTVLRPGGVAIWVVKAFVKNKQRVDFPGQWQALCEAAGFEPLHQHRAWLVEDRGAQFDLFGDLHEKKVERKSFFRRLAENKGSPRIDWEVVICMRKL